MMHLVRIPLTYLARSAVVAAGLMLTQCTPHISDGSYDLKGQLLPKVALAPLRIETPHPITWDYGEELSYALERELNRMDRVKIVSHERLTALGKIPHDSLWTSSDLRLANEFRGADFLVLCTLVEYQKKPVQPKYQHLGAPKRPEKILHLRAYVRVINLTNHPYTLALQEYINVEDVTTPRQEIDAASVRDWSDPKYRHSHYAIATNKLLRPLADHILNAVSSAWNRRPPPSHHERHLLD